MRTGHLRTGVVVGSLFVALAIAVLAMLRWGGYILVHSDRLPPHADVAVVLSAGSGASEGARIDGAVDMLRLGMVNHVLLSLPREGFWGQAIPSVAGTYLERKYGKETAAHIQYCETAVEVNSTAQEARAIFHCMETKKWQSIIVVTSNFHSRRAGMIWRRTRKRENIAVQIWVDGVPDPLFHPNQWWSNRLYAKTWFLEFTKLVWSSAFER